MSDKRDQNPGQDDAQPLADAGRRRFLGGAAALGAGGIEDVTIEDPPMEEVIHDIYAAVA